MAILSEIERYCGEIGPEYSESSRKMTGTIKSHYNKLYHACLLHLIGGRDGEIKAMLEGLFAHLKDGMLEDHPSLIGDKHDGRYVSMHLSAIYYQLVAEYLPEHPPVEAMARLSPEGIRAELAGLDYSNSWYVSNIIMAYAVLMAFNDRAGMNAGCLSACADFLDSKQDVATGLWKSSRKPSLLNSMAGAFHYLPLYKYLGREVKHADRLFDSISSLVLKSGTFCSPNGYVCLDYDGISSLYFLHSACLGRADRDARSGKLLEAAGFLRDTLMAQINPDGGFPEAGKPGGTFSVASDLVASSMRHGCFRTFLWNARFAGLSYMKPNRMLKSNSVASCSARLHESNTFATWFRYMTLSICEDILADGGALKERSAPQKRFKLPGLGYL